MAKKHRIVKGDRVKVIRGNFRELEGTVLEVLRDKERVRVEGVNMRKGQTRRSQQKADGGIISCEAPSDMSRVMLIDPATEEASRVRIQVEEDGVKERIAVKSGNPIPKPQ